MADMPPVTHLRLARTALRVGGRCGFALAGGHAVAAHGILSRPSEDVDLFADWQSRADFPAVVDEVISAYVAEGLEVQVDLRLETFVRLYLTDKNHPHEHHKVELVVNWRAQPPVEMDIGPVLHLDDVMAGKVDALYNRAAARDFLDIDAAITTGRYTLNKLCELAHHADNGFDRAWFAAMVRHIQRLVDEDFAEYGLTPSEIMALRARVTAWLSQLLPEDPT